MLAEHGWDRAFWVVLDEGAVWDCVALLGHTADSRADQGWVIHRLQSRQTGDGGKTEDAESVARHDGWVYVFGSHFGSKDGPLQPKRGFVARFREDQVGRVDADRAVEIVISRRSFVLHRLVNDALRTQGPRLIDLQPRSRQAFILRTARRGAEKDKRWNGLIHDGDYPLNIEGAAFRADGSLLLGLRFPVAAGGEPILIEVEGIQRLFAPPSSRARGETTAALPEIAGFWVVDAVGRDGAMAGIRDLALHDGELHLVTGNIDAREKGSVLLQDYPGGRHTVSTHWRCALPPNDRGGRLPATVVREFPDLPRIEGLAIGSQGAFFYVSDEDEGVFVRHTRFLVKE